MPFGHGIGNPDDYYPNERWLKEPKVTSRQFVRSGPGYTLSKSLIDDSVSAEVHNSSKTEPAVNTSFIVSAVPVAVTAVSLLFPNLLSADNWSLVIYVIALFAPIVTALMIRGKVWSPASVKTVLEAAIEEAEKTRN